MDVSIIDFIIKSIATEGIWFALALGMGWLFKKEIDRSRVKSEEREDKLIQQLDKYNEQLGKNVEALERLEKNFNILNAKIDQIQNKQKGE